MILINNNYLFLPKPFPKQILVLFLHVGRNENDVPNLGKHTKLFHLNVERVNTPKIKDLSAIRFTTACLLGPLVGAGIGSGVVLIFSDKIELFASFSSSVESSEVNLSRLEYDGASCSMSAGVSGSVYAEICESRATKNTYVFLRAT
jgi:hypothetical protein